MIMMVALMVDLGFDSERWLLGNVNIDGCDDEGCSIGGVVVG